MKRLYIFSALYSLFVTLILLVNLAIYNINSNKTFDPKTL